MAEARYYWIKMPKDFFSLPAIRYIKSLKLGGDILLLYLQLLTESTDKGGKLRLTDELAYTWESLAATVGMSIDSVSEGMRVLTSLGLVKILPDDTIFMTEQEKLTQSETSDAQRMREKRKLDALQKQAEQSPNLSEQKGQNKDLKKSSRKAKGEHCSEVFEQRYVEKEKEIEKEIEIEEKEKRKEKWAPPRPKAKSNNVFLDMLREESGP